MSTPINRRSFLEKSTHAGLGLTLASAFPFVAKGASGANGRLRAAVIGLNGRGRTHVKCLTSLPNVEVAYLCDVDDRAIDKGIKEAAKKQPAQPKGVKDFRRILEDRTVDAVTIATPDHWHAPMAILALAAGKHVYVEKPCSHNPREGELLLAAVKKHGRLVQMGNQRRSIPVLQKLIKEIHDGLIGKTYFARGWYANGRGPIGRGTVTAVPGWLDYDLWQGPAPRKPYRSNLIHYNWHWFWHWGTAETLNNGTHEMDVARWALGVDNPTKVTSVGGRYHFQDDWETPDTQMVGWDFPGGKSMSWEGRSCNKFTVDGRARGVMVYGANGSALIDGAEYVIYDKQNKIVREAKDQEAVDSTDPTSSTGAGTDTTHVKNFVDAIRTGSPLSAPIVEANVSVNLLHLANIAGRVGRSLQCDPADARILNDPEAMKLWGREYEPGWEPKV